MSKKCIFNEKKICDNCGDCEVCELNSNKKCDNCGKCLELEGYDVKAIKIDEVFENEGPEKIEDTIYNKDKINAIESKEENTNDEQSKTEDYNSFLEEEELLKSSKDDYIPQNNEVWEFIDDIDGVKELLDEQEDNSAVLKEEFPGLIRLKNK
ncbi:hypothetical protein [Clostridium psychrophilum]|uniref:hypothetical protein n=1 Tax=Clostridium psychrophilum TaxID=132926 RepID=UPI001C0CBB89|nr:hypothetical protein [Clostridium psychrophilum]MBU3182278.1 hypothetical protein [Clostridium psychrophilum]